MKYDKKELIRISNEFLNAKNGLTTENMTYVQAHMTYKQCRTMDINNIKKAHTQVHKPINQMDLSSKPYSKRTFKGGINE